MTTDPIDKVSKEIDRVLAAISVELEANGAEVGDVTNTRNRTEESIARWRGNDMPQHQTATAPNPIEQCISLFDQVIDPAPESIRTIHNLSCTGGTLIAKCIASMPNVLLLNEVDPLSPMPFIEDNPPFTPRKRASFTPTDMVSLLRQGDPDISSDLIKRLFIANLEIIKEEHSKIGKTLILRDHAHGHFLTGEKIEERPTLRHLIMGHFTVKSLVTVRDPINSYLSMKENGWHQYFAPSSFEEYCRRYLVFLNQYQDVEIVKYEDFVVDPPLIMKRICGVLELDYSDMFSEVFDVFRFSGDSGRSGGVIEERPRREMDERVISELKGAASYRELALQLGYEILN